MFYRIAKLILSPLLRLLWRPHVQGLEHVPVRGAVILASNHLSFIDSVFLPLMVPRPVRFIAKAEYFEGSGWKDRLRKWFLLNIGAIPVDRSGGSEAEMALRAGQEVLERGEVFGIYPEGTRSPDGRLYKGKTGVARLALATKTPVVPVAMLNTDQLQPIGKRVPRIGKVYIRIGKSLDFSRYSTYSHDRAFERAITDEIMDSIRRLSGQEYTDIYAAQVKAQH
ncbi:lysophospholipid acyltransferase family protein [Haloglycomyces albus]|uniref:lysophospholipid acyltransferase family protein n=1 Tax=Haloglycomyces albus TaxID=526067 RepID=UPI00046D5431|nr:lysophospholipid acyltransferase family protein [Haloglycomyces albus]